MGRGDLYKKVVSFWHSRPKYPNVSGRPCPAHDGGQAIAHQRCQAKPQAGPRGEGQDLDLVHEGLGTCTHQGGFFVLLE